jgi:hypothetical protein
VLLVRGSDLFRLLAEHDDLLQSLLAGVLASARVIASPGHDRPAGV